MGIKAFGHGDDFVNKFVRAIVSDSTGLDAVNPEPPPDPPTQASGGVISDYTDPGPGIIYRSHLFATTGTFDISQLSPDVTTADFLLIGGGGGGGDNIGGAHGGNGGGGAGGYVEGNALPIAEGDSFTITIGGGASAIAQGTGTPGSSRNGTNSTIAGPTITTITAKGGGGGGNDNNDTVGDGGSGGGTWGGGGAGPTTKGDKSQPGTNSLYGATDYGNDGGSTPGASPEYCGGGGGGAGGAGGDANPTSDGGDGGAGRASTIAYGPGNPKTYATGGAGSNTPYGGTNGSAAPNGGAATGESGLYSTGGGGGGSPAGTQTDVNGGSGYAVIRYQIGSITAAKATGGAVSFYGGKTIHTFTNTGDFNNTSGSPLTIEYIAIAGGGGGGGGTRGGGGGGAGGVRTNISGWGNIAQTTIPAVGPGSPNKLTVTVGSGGAGGYGPVAATRAGTTGGVSSIVGPGPINVSSTGGGYGASGDFPNIYPGGPGSDTVSCTTKVVEEGIEATTYFLLYPELPIPVGLIVLVILFS
jgi:hypothetical protein